MGRGGQTVSAEQGAAGPGSGDRRPQRVVAWGRGPGPRHSSPCFPSNPDTISQGHSWPRRVSEQRRAPGCGTCSPPQQAH